MYKANKTGRGLVVHVADSTPEAREVLQCIIYGMVSIYYIVRIALMTRRRLGLRTFRTKQGPVQRST